MLLACGEGPWALVTPINAIRVGVGLFYKKLGLLFIPTSGHTARLYQEFN